MHVKSDPKGAYLTRRALILLVIHSNLNYGISKVYLVIYIVVLNSVNFKYNLTPKVWGRLVCNIWSCLFFSREDMRMPNFPLKTTKKLSIFFSFFLLRNSCVSIDPPSLSLSLYIYVHTHMRVILSCIARQKLYTHMYVYSLTSHVYYVTKYYSFNYLISSSSHWVHLIFVDSVLYFT